VLSLSCLQNILLDGQGHLRLSDFGLGHQLNPEKGFQITGQAGTRGYQAPEVLKNEYYGCEVDVFSYGVTIYELLHGQRPWKDLHREADGEGSGSGGIDVGKMKEFPISSKLSANCASFLRGVLAYEWQHRLGCAPKNVSPEDGSFLPADQFVNWDEMRQHPWFAEIDWAQLYAKKVTPPFTPDNSRANVSLQETHGASRRD
jgi:serine/threonine protein kinase